MLRLKKEISKIGELIKFEELYSSKILIVCLLVLTINMFRTGNASGQNSTIELNMSKPELWTVDVVHLGSKQIDISYDAKDNATVMLPKWSKDGASSTDVATRNIGNGRLHSYQHIPMSDCSQSEVTFEINIPQA